MENIILSTVAIILAFLAGFFFMPLVGTARGACNGHFLHYDALTGIPYIFALQTTNLTRWYLELMCGRAKDRGNEKLARAMIYIAESALEAEPKEDT